jgi:hypothetical protein
MASNKILRLGPVALTTTTTTNIWNPPTLTGGTGLAGTNTNTYLVIRHVRVVNKTNAAASLALWLGATGANTAGTEAIFGGAATAGALNAGTGVSVPANSYVDWYGQLRVDVADFIVGGAGTATALTIEAEGEIGIV